MYIHIPNYPLSGSFAIAFKTMGAFGCENITFDFSNFSIWFCFLLNSFVRGIRIHPDLNIPYKKSCYAYVDSTAIGCRQQFVFSIFLTFFTVLCGVFFGASSVFPLATSSSCHCRGYSSCSSCSCDMKSIQFVI